MPKLDADVGEYQQGDKGDKEFKVFAVHGGSWGGRVNLLTVFRLPLDALFVGEPLMFYFRLPLGFILGGRGGYSKWRRRDRVAR